MIHRMFITGGSGLLAVNWALAMRKRFSVVLGLNRRQISLKGVTTRRTNLESVDGLVVEFDSIDPKIVVHAAGLADVEACEANPYLAHHINVELAANVAQACAKLDLMLVHISTDHLFSGEASLVEEDDPVDPKNTYARTKFEAEVRVLEACPKALVIRTNFYGWGPQYRPSFSDIVIKALRSNQELLLFQDVFYTPILIEMLVVSVHELLNRNARGIFHIVGDERLSKFEFGHCVAKHFNLDSNLVRSAHVAERPSLVRRPRDMSLSNKKICQFLGRNLGGVDRHLTQLWQQEQSGLAEQLQGL